MSLDGDCREGGMFAFSAIRLKLAFSEISYCTFKVDSFFFLLKYTVALTVNGILSLLSLTPFVLVVSWLCSRHVTHVLLSLFNVATGMCVVICLC